MKRFFNALMGWDLVNLNAEQSNYPAADLGDATRRIAVQVTNQNAGSKITETAKKAIDHQLGKKFDRIIIFFLLPEKPSVPKAFEQPANGPGIECWDLADLLKLMAELPEQSRIADAAEVLSRELSREVTGIAPPPSNLPGGYIGQTFVGREEFLKDLRASLLKQTHATAITQSMARQQQPAATVAEGLGGLGKTHAAVEYAHRHRAEYSALLFVSGDSPQKLQSSLAALCEVKGLSLDKDLPNEEEARAGIALHWLATHPGWLLIVDNVDDAEAAQALTAHFDQLRQGHVLITSRLHHWSNQVDSLELSVLSTEDGADLLLQLTDKHRRKTADDDTQARTLATLMEGLPLALHQAAGYINENACTLAEYLTTYQHEAAELLNWFDNLSIPYERPDKKVPRPVLITWKTSFDQLTEDARRWLLVFSHYAPEPIPEFLVEAAPNAKEEVKALLRGARQALAQMSKLGLITRFKDEPPRFKIHRLVQEVTRLSGGVAKHAAALDLGIRLMDLGCPGDPQDVQTWKKWNPLMSHAQALCYFASDEPAPERLSWLLSCLSLLLDTKSLYAQAEPLIRRALQLDEANFGPNHPVVATRLNNLSTLLLDMNQMAEAELLMNRALQIDEASFGPDHTQVSIRLNNLAQLFQATNRLEEAEPLMRRALQIDEASFGPDNPSVAIRLNNLARLLQETDRQSEAEPLMRRALKINEDNYGPAHPAVAVGLNNLAGLLLVTNRMAEAESLMRRALQIDEVSFGPGHPDVALDLNNLATLFQDTNRSAQAEPLMRQAVGIFVRRLGMEHPNSQTLVGNYIGLLQALELPETEIEKRVREAVGGGAGEG